jgi:hypothetical protein
MGYTYFEDEQGNRDYMFKQGSKGQFVPLQGVDEKPIVWLIPLAIVVFTLGTLFLLYKIFH